MRFLWLTLVWVFVYATPARGCGTYSGTGTFRSVLPFAFAAMPIDLTFTAVDVAMAIRGRPIPAAYAGAEVALALPCALLGGYLLGLGGLNSDDRNTKNALGGVVLGTSALLTLHGLYELSRDSPTTITLAPLISPDAIGFAAGGRF